MAPKKTPKEEIRKILDDEQLSEILLVVDRKHKTVDAVKNIGKDGNVETIPADKENQPEFMVVGHNSDALDIAVTAVKNFYRQSRDPTRFELLKIPVKTFNAIKNTALFLKSLSSGKRTKAAGEFIDKHRVEISTGLNNNKNKETDIMAKKETSASAEVAAQNAAGESKYRYNESMIDWKSIEEAGISREYLKDKGLLEGMLKGYKTEKLVPISLTIGKAVSLQADARLSFKQSVTGPVQLAIHGLRQEPQLQRPYMGHIFSEEDKKNLKESGNMGRAVELKNRNNELHPYLISIDRMTNEISATRADKVFIPDEVSGVKLTDQEKNDLREGKKIYVEGMVSKTGKEFDAHIQINADKRGIEYIFPENKLENIQIIGGVQLSAKQQQDLKEGRAIFVEDMKRKDGELFSSYIKNDPNTKNLSYTRYNPDSPEGAREIYIPKEIGGGQAGR